MGLFNKQITELYKDKYKLISIVVYLFVCTLYCVKYLSKVSALASVVGTVLFIAGIMLLLYKGDRFGRYTQTTLLVVYTILGGILVPILFPVGTFRLDRWDMIEVFWNALLDKQYPFAASGLTSDNTPAQSPFYFLICFPFYVTKWYVGIPLVGLWMYRWAIRIMNKSSNQSMLMLLASPFILHEVMTCSSIFFNSALFIVWISYLWIGRDLNVKSMAVHGFVGGLLLCTRNCYIIPMMTMGLTMLRLQDKKIVWFWGVSVVISFLLAYLPFVFGWGLDSWYKWNPFKVQSEMIISVDMMAVILTITIVLGLCCKNFKQATFVAGICLFLANFILFIEKTWESGIEYSLLESGTDISYFVLCIPFLMLFVDTKK